MRKAIGKNFIGKCFMPHPVENLGDVQINQDQAVHEQLSQKIPLPYEVRKKRGSSSDLQC